LLFVSLCLWAQNVPQTIDYQGRLADSDGNYLNEVVTLDFLIYDMETAGTVLWTETQDISCINGVFHVQLGAATPIPGTLFDISDPWLELVVGGETLAPRTAIASVPYAIKAETAYTLQNMGSGSGLDADLLDGQDSSNFMPASATFGDITAVTAGTSLNGGGTSGDVTLNVDVPLVLSGNVDYPYGVIRGENSGSGSGIYGYSSGYYGGYFNANCNSLNTHVIHAEFTGTYSDAIGVYGKSRPVDNFGYGGIFEGGYRGVLGQIYPTGNAIYQGVRGYVSGGSGTNSGVYGYASGSGTNYAGYFNGNLHYTGTLSGPSDERLKENIQPLELALAKIMQMKVHTYNYIQMEEEKQFALPEGEQIGLIAQELEEILPGLVDDNVHAYDKNEGVDGAEKDVEKFEYKGINYIGLIPVLIEAMKEQQEQIEELQKQIKSLI